MPRLRQELQVWSFTNKKKTLPEFLFIDRKSIGTIWVNGKPFTYNAELVYHGEEALNKTAEDIIEDYEKKRRKKRVIIIKRKSR